MSPVYTHGPKWYQFTLSQHSAPPISVCPFCNQPMKQSEKAQRWLLLMLPFFVATFINIFALPKSVVPDWAVWALGALGVVGAILARATSRLEKVHGI